MVTLTPEPSDSGVVNGVFQRLKAMPSKVAAPPKTAAPTRVPLSRKGMRVLALNEAAVIEAVPVTVIVRR
jgi:hypothetical protein